MFFNGDLTTDWADATDFYLRILRIRTTTFYEFLSTDLRILRIYGFYGLGRLHFTDLNYGI
ncbi:MAG: hypothetical protein U5L45_10515 [Saprospiraceae bacterium]|nr:hypothetical protein [Saprospiraceae bacterium]